MEVENVKGAEDVEDEDSPAESRLARKVASFGMAAGRYYTLWRMNSEGFSAPDPRSGSFLFRSRGDSLHMDFISLSHTIHNFNLTSRLRSIAPQRKGMRSFPRPRPDRETVRFLRTGIVRRIAHSRKYTGSA